MKRLVLVALALPLAWLALACDPLAFDAGPYTLDLIGPNGPASGRVYVVAAPSDPTATLRIDFTLDGDATIFDTDITSPWGVDLDPGLVADGPHTLHAFAATRDGQSAEAALELLLDNAGPVVGATRPAEGDRIPASGELTLLVNAADPVGVTGGSARFDDETMSAYWFGNAAAVLPIPEASLFPVPRTIHWDVRDAAGNHTAGALGVWQTHVTWAREYAGDGELVVVPLADSRVIQAAGAAVTSFDAAGIEEWTVELDNGRGVVAVAPVADGAAWLFAYDGVTLSVLMLDASGDLTWQLPEPGTTYLDFSFDPATQTALLSQVVAGVDPAPGQLVRLEATGAAAVLATLEEGFVGGWLAPTYPGADPAAVAVWERSTITPDPPADRIAMLSASGTLLWSTPLAVGVYGLYALSDAVALVAVPGADLDEVDLLAIGEAGALWTLFPDDYERLTNGQLAPGNDFVLYSEVDGYQGRLQRLHADGSVAFDLAFDESIHAWRLHDDTLLVALARSVSAYDATGAELFTWEPDRASTPIALSDSVLLDLAVAPDGSFLADASGMDSSSVIWRVSATGELLWEERFAAPASPMALWVSAETAAAVFLRFIEYDPVSCVPRYAIDLLAP